MRFLLVIQCNLFLLQPLVDSCVLCRLLSANLVSCRLQTIGGTAVGSCQCFVVQNCTSQRKYARPSVSAAAVVGASLATSMLATCGCVERTARGQHTNAKQERITLQSDGQGRWKNLRTSRYFENNGTLFCSFAAEVPIHGD